MKVRKDEDRSTLSFKEGGSLIIENGAKTTGFGFRMGFIAPRRGKWPIINFQQTQPLYPKQSIITHQAIEPFEALGQERLITVIYLVFHFPCVSHGTKAFHWCLVVSRLQTDEVSAVFNAAKALLNSRSLTLMHTSPVR